eukprot:27742-Eustigmatos_ZCMA.PRE.1
MGVLSHETDFYGHKSFWRVITGSYGVAGSVASKHLHFMRQNRLGRITIISKGVDLHTVSPDIAPSHKHSTVSPYPSLGSVSPFLTNRDLRLSVPCIVLCVGSLAPPTMCD